MSKPTKGQFGYSAAHAADYSAWASSAGQAGHAARAQAGPRRSWTAAALVKKHDLERRRRTNSLRSAPSGIHSGAREGAQPEVPFMHEPRFRLEPRADGRRRARMVEAPPEVAPCTSNRIWSMSAVQELAGRMRCSDCRKVGTLVVSQAHEKRFGLLSDVGLYCSGDCKRVTLTLPTTARLAPSRKGGFGAAEINLRFNIGAAQAGMDRNGVNMLLDCVDCPRFTPRTWNSSKNKVNDACVVVGKRSRSCALQQEQLAAYGAGATIGADGSIGIGISEDGRWNSRKSAKNAMGCSVAAMGEETGLVVASGYLTKDCAQCKVADGGHCSNGHCNRTYSGPSGNMEALLGAEIVTTLNSAAGQGARVERLCADLDSQLMKVVREACADVGDAPPQPKTDANHCVKAIKGKMLPDTKKAVATRGVLTKAVVDELTRQIAYALHKFKRCGDKATLRGALLNVIDHFFNRHQNCALYFCCAHVKQPLKPSSLPGGKWLDELGGATLEAALRADFEKRLTGAVAVEKLLTKMSTQGLESLHNVHATQSPKRLNHEGSGTGRARQSLGHARWNDGVAASTAAVESELGMPHGKLTARGLRDRDRERAYFGARVRTTRVMAMRREARKARKVRDAPRRGGGGGGGGRGARGGRGGRGGGVGRGGRSGRGGGVGRSGGGSARGSRGGRGRGGRGSRGGYAANSAWDDDDDNDDDNDDDDDDDDDGRDPCDRSSEGSGDDDDDDDDDDGGDDDDDGGGGGGSSAQGGGHDWSVVEETEEGVADAHPPWASIVGADVIVLARAWPDFALECEDAIGWRGLVEAKRSGCQVCVFGSWFNLNDASKLRPAVQ